MGEDDVSRLVLSMPDVLQCWVQADHDAGTLDIFVRLDARCSEARRTTFEHYLSLMIVDHYLGVGIDPRVHVVDRIKFTLEQTE